MVNISDTGTASKFGADDTDKINKYFSGIDVDDADINSDTWYRSGKFGLWNPAGTFKYIFVPSAITTANKNITIPLLTADDTAVTQAFAQTLTNKTIESDNNTIKHSTTNTAGDILRNTGTKFDRLAVGTAYQLLRVNTGVTDLEWASYPRLLDKTTTDVSITNTVTETSLYSVSLPANTVVSHGIVDIEMDGTYLNNSAGTATITLIIKYGTTTMYNDITNAMGQAATRRQWYLRARLSPDNNSSSAQILSGRWAISDVGGTTTGLGNSDDDEIQVWTPFGGTSAENAASGSLTFDIRFTHGTADPNISITRKVAFVRYSQ